MSGSVRMIDFPVKGDSRGSLIALESLGDLIPFEIRRVYYIFDTTPGTIRGHHAHRQLRQVLICISGACTIVCDDGKNVSEYHLDWPDKGLYIEGAIWREMKNFSKGAALVVLASEHYDESDYIRNYACFRKEVENG